MTEQTALDRTIDRIRQIYALIVSFDNIGWLETHCGLNRAVEYARMDCRKDFTQALQDPRYLAFCKEQDLADQGIYITHLSADQMKGDAVKWGPEQGTKASDSLERLRNYRHEPEKRRSNTTEKRFDKPISGATRQATI